ncbi:AAA family ATPase [Streptococcus oralis]|nr:AAA family ATPase [Streptococcus oralis]MCY7085514.1 AAA family ATPase [Streptococcus oralis]
MARYLVGPYNNSWNFMDAVEKAQNGDTIEFEDGYAFQWPTDRVIVIKKNLHFVGHVVPNPNGNGRLFNNTIEASFQIAGGAEVSFENLWFKITDNYATFSVLAGSKISCNQIYFETTISENKKCMIYAEAKSKVILNDVGMSTPEKHNSMIKIDSSELSISDATILSRIYAVGGSKISLDNVYLQKYDHNAINVRNSEVTLKNCTVKGGNLEKGYPIIWLKNVIWQSENSVLEMPGFTAVNLTKNVRFGTVSDRISALSSFESTVLAHDMTITEFLGIDKESFASLKGVTNFLTESQKKIPFGAFTNSVVLADQMIFHKLFAPNLRIKGSSFVKTNALSYAQGDARDLKVELEDGSDYIVGKESAQGGSTANSATGEVGVEKRDALEELNNLVGLEKVKHEIKKMINMVEFNKKRIASGKTPEKQTLHAAFMGNPGTGKTTVARLLGEALYEAGVLSGEEFRFVEATESDLISSSVGGTAEQTQHLLEKARGGILFIDEAYSLDKKGSSVNFGIEAVNTILKFMEDNRDDIMIIFAGYTKEMEEFFKTNPGLRSRVPNNFIFEDYTGDEIVQLGEMILKKGDYKLEDRDYYARHVKRAYDGSLDKSNGRWIRNLDEQLTKTLADRVVAQGSDDIETILNIDIDAVLNQGKYQEGADKEEDGMAALNRLIGIPKVKEQVEQFVAMAEFNQKRAEQGGVVADTTLHSLFLGNPGTGKTTVARILGNILFQKGVIKQKKFIEVSRSNLVGGYQGHTALKTREVLESALGGVLFIDEAYALYKDSNDSFGKEALDEILKFMEDHRRDIVIIFAGYTKEMYEFLQVNSGLQSRIPTTFDFEDYTPDEIVEIGLLGLHKQGYQVNKALYADVVKLSYTRSNDNSNGRWVRNFNEKLLRQVSTRVARDGSSDYNSILDQDLEVLREN